MITDRRALRVRAGFSSLMATVYVVLFASLATAYVAMSGANTEASANVGRIDRAMRAAESGLSILRYHIAGLTFKGNLSSDEIFTGLGQQLAAEFDGTMNTSGHSVAYSQTQILVPEIAADAAMPDTVFSARISRNGTTYILEVTGRMRDVSRTIRIDFAEAEGPLDRMILQHGISSQGALVFNGAATMRSNIPGGSAVMSLDTEAWRPIRVNGTGQFDGDFYMTKDGLTGADVFNNTNSTFLSADGTTYDSNEDAHTHSGVPEPQWPTVDTAPFASLIAALPRTVVTSTTDTSSMSSLHNVLIKAGANPTFKSGVNIQGLIYIEWPNRVTFNGSATITGIIACQPPPYTPDVDDPATNLLRFNGAVTSSGVENLPDTAEYAGLRDKTGSFILAPDYETEFNGAMGTVNGTIYTSELDLNGKTTGTVRGAILVDRRRQFTKFDSVDLYFIKGGTDDVPAGLVFDKLKVLQLVPSSYQEITP
ncbi:MAG: hypothetical protein BIFFINMI_03995 [Phycisphaerae bacterium]|nr:hypothetical protein [Phycisphaerae bacterium]